MTELEWDGCLGWQQRTCVFAGAGLNSRLAALGSSNNNNNNTAPRHVSKRSLRRTSEEEEQEEEER